MADNNMNETISALVDGEMDQQRMHGLIREMRNRSEYRDRWEQYHLIGDALRNNLPTRLDHSFASRVSEAIALEDVPANPFQTQQHAVSHGHGRKPVIGFAIAASVAMLAYVGIGMIAVEEQGVTVVPSIANSNPVPAGNVPLDVQTVEGKHWDIAQPAVESKLNNYLNNHRDVVTTSGMNTQVLPYSRFVVSKPEQRSE